MVAPSVIPCSKTGDPGVVFPTCIFGSCNSTFVVPQCECQPGYLHDRITGRYNNCGMPDWVPYVATSLSIAIHIVATLYGLWVVFFRSSWRSMAWRVAVSATASSLSFLAASISLFATAPVFEMPWYGAIFIDMGSAFIGFAVGIMVVIALAPLSRFSKSKLGLEFFTKFMMIVLPGFLLIGCTICTIVGYAARDDQVITDMMGGIYVVLAIASLVACPIMGIHMRNFVKALDAALQRYDTLHVVPLSGEEETSNSTPDSPAHGSKRESMGGQVQSAAKLRMLRTKVFRFMITSTVCAFAVFAVCLFCACCQFAARTVPFSWLVYYMIIIALGLFSLQLSHSGIKNESRRNRLSLLGTKRSKQASDAVVVGAKLEGSVA